MYSGELNVNGVYSLPVTHNLIGIEGTSPDEIDTVISHPQALAQCEKYIKQNGLKALTAGSTADAAELVAKEGNPRLAAIASEESAKLNGLKVLKYKINEIES